MKMFKGFFGFMFLSVLLTSAASARPILRPFPGIGFNKKIVLNINTTYSGFNSIKLKQLIKQKHPRLNLQQFKLKKVTLDAKSFLGSGTAALKIGFRSFYPETVPGTPQLYYLPLPHTYHQVVLNAPLHQQRGPYSPWQVNLNGKIKVKKAIVVIGK